MTEFLDALHAPGPVPSLAPALMQFGRFVGSWDLDVTYYDEAGGVRKHSAGEWHFDWILEGRAIADVWTIPPRAARTRLDPPPGEYGVSVRFWDPRIAAWRSTWHGPVHGITWPFIARQVHDEMILERTDDAGDVVRWIFSEITEDSFHWRAIRSSDEGATWRVEQVMLARRRSP